MYYHRFNNLAELLNKDLPTKIRQGILSRDLMDRECNCYITSKFNAECVCKGKCQKKCLIYELKCSMCESIYLGKTQQTLKKIMDSHFSNLLSLHKNGQNSDSFAAHFGYNFNSTT